MAEAMHKRLPARPGSSFGLAQRLFVVALRNGVERFCEDASLWAAVLPGLEPNERDQVAAHFTAGPPKVVLGYPREAVTAPVVAVVLQSDRPEAEFLGDELDLTDEGELRGAYHRKALSVLVLSRHPDVTLFVYEWALAVLRAHTDWLELEGVQAVTFVSGGEIRPDPQYLPLELYACAQEWSCAGLSTLTVPLPPPPTGLRLFLEPASPEGGVRLTPYREENP